MTCHVARSTGPDEIKLGAIVAAGGGMIARRRALKRGPWRRQHPLEIRPGQAGGYGPGWRLLCQRIKARDGSICRHCGHKDVGGQTDHLLPRRLFSNRRDPERDAPENLAWLCAFCHGIKTSLVEPALYRADYLTFSRFLSRVSHSGPIPSTEIVGRALARLVELRRNGE